jgi:hypothetical protein
LVGSLRPCAPAVSLFHQHPHLSSSSFGIDIDRPAVDYLSRSPNRWETEKGIDMSNTVVTKQGQPSKPGEVVDTSKATVVPASPEVRTEAAAREVATQRKETQAKIDGLPKKMTGGAKAKGSKAKAPTKTRGTGNGSGPSTRITAEWLSAKKKDVKVKDEVTVNGVVIAVIGRWTKRKGDAMVPMVTGRIVSGAPDGKKKGDRHNVVAEEATHVK